MAKKLRVVVEVGPKEKRFVAVAPDWPGLERGGKSADSAIETLQDYLPRYEPVAKLANMTSEFDSSAEVRELERYPGTGSTDFWGISFAFSSTDTRTMTDEQFERELKLMRASWKFFDEVRARVSEEMKAGPRGGGRNRDRIVRHTLAAEQDWAKKIGLRLPRDEVIVDAVALKAYRRDYCKAIRRYHAEGMLARRWPLRYLIRHTAFHTLDHAWEMEDKDLTV